jgi:asparagine synthase (glutamine-hydrolysing)
MCGIAGMAFEGRRRDETPDEALLRRMVDTLVHRGPDGSGLFAAPGVGLGMRRLAVIDVEGGRQPMSNETGEITVVFNGEIYNHRELHAELERKGHHLATRSDTEVIPHLYEEHGVGFLERLNGMFAIALWDAPRRRLLLARDEIGVKPLYWARRDGRLCFGSEPKAILAAGGSAREIDLVGLDQLLTFEYTASPRTLFRDVHKLPPGGWLVLQDGAIETGSCFAWPRDADRRGDPAPDDADGWAARLRTTLDAAVERQMISDVPLGALLSGGIDSSILVSAMSRASARPVRTFSIGFADKSYDELRYARVVAQRFGTEHHEAVLEPRALDLVERVVGQLDQPIADFSVFPTLLVSQIARQHVTVALSGDGGDELFAGYDAYLADRLSRIALDPLPLAVRRALLAAAGLVPGSPAKKGLRNTVKRLLEGAALPARYGHQRWMVFLSPEQRAALYRPDFLRAVEGQAEKTLLAYLDNPGPDPLQRAMNVDLRFYLPEDILPKVDLMSMAVSLEARVPYLDDEVVRLALRIPSALKLRRGVRKWILRRAYADQLPPEILARGKEGFSIPMKTWLTQEWRPLVHDLLAPATLARDGLFEPRAVARFIAEHESGRANHSHLLWALLVFQLWKRAHIEAASA